MEEILIANGGQVYSGGSMTHLVVDEKNVDSLPEDRDIPEKCCVVKGEWFWYSIQIGAAADVNKYKWRSGDGNTTATLLSPYRSGSVFSPPTPLGRSS